MNKTNTKISGWLKEYEKGKIEESALLAKIISQFSEAELPYLFSSLFTEDEVETFIHRLLIIKKLKENITQHEIAGSLKVGVATVTRGAKEIEKGKFKFI